MSPIRVVVAQRRRFSPTSNTCFLAKMWNDSSSSSLSVILVRRLLTFMVIFAAASASCFLLHRESDPFRFIPRISLPFYPCFPFASEFGDSSLVSHEYRLRKVLRDAAMEDGTVILTTLNEAWAAPDSIFDLFLESFRIGNATRSLLNHVVIVALDREAFRRCFLLHTHCFALITEGVDFHQEAYFMTPPYLRMMWTRIDFLRSVLEMGHHFVFTDADIMWFRNPFPQFYNDSDFQIACDHFNGSPEDINNSPNGGFKYVKSNNRSIEFYKYWHFSRLTHPGYHDQDVLNFIKDDPLVKDLGLQMRFLDTAHFGGFCEPSEDLNVVCTMHANCCLGLGSKLHDIRIMIEDWKSYMSMPPSSKHSSVSSWSVPQECRI